MTSPQTTRTARTSPARRVALIAAAVVGLGALGIGCGKTATTASTDTTATTVKTAGTSPSSAGSSGSSGSTGTARPPATGATTPATTCVSAPASTTANPKQGGGELVCGPVAGGSDPGSSTGSPPMTDTTEGPTDPALPTPDATHGVVQVFATGGYECDGDPCPAIGIIMQGSIRLADVTADRAGAVQAIGQTGGANFVTGPGHYSVTAETNNGSCVPQSVDVVANKTVTVSLDCTVPYKK